MKKIILMSVFILVCYNTVLSKEYHIVLDKEGNVILIMHNYNIVEIKTKMASVKEKINKLKDQIDNIDKKDSNAIEEIKYELKVTEKNIKYLNKNIKLFSDKKNFINSPEEINIIMDDIINSNRLCYKDIDLYYYIKDPDIKVYDYYVECKEEKREYASIPLFTDVSIAKGILKYDGASDNKLLKFFHKIVILYNETETKYFNEYSNHEYKQFNKKITLSDGMKYSISIIKKNKILLYEADDYINGKKELKSIEIETTSTPNSENKKEQKVKFKEVPIINEPIYSQVIKTNRSYMLGLQIAFYIPVEGRFCSPILYGPLPANDDFMIYRQKKEKVVKPLLIGTIYPFWPGIEPDNFKLNNWNWLRRFQLSVGFELSKNIFQDGYFGFGYCFTYVSANVIFCVSKQEQTRWSHKGFSVIPAFMGNDLTKKDISWICGIAFSVPMEFWIAKLIK